jgi:hypothetical protein
MTQEQINMSASADIEIFLKLYLLRHCQNLHSTLATFGWKVCVNCNVARNVKRDKKDTTALELVGSIPCGKCVGFEFFVFCMMSRILYFTIIDVRCVT